MGLIGGRRHGKRQVSAERLDSRRVLVNPKKYLKKKTVVPVVRVGKVEDMPMWFAGKGLGMGGVF